MKGIKRIKTHLKGIFRNVELVKTNLSDEDGILFFKVSGAYEPIYAGKETSATEFIEVHLESEGMGFMMLSSNEYKIRMDHIQRENATIEQISGDLVNDLQYLLKPLLPNDSKRDKIIEKMLESEVLDYLLMRTAWFLCAMSGNVGTDEHDQMYG